MSAEDPDEEEAYPMAALQFLQSLDEVDPPHL